MKYTRKRGSFVSKMWAELFFCYRSRIPLVGWLPRTW